MLESPASFD